ncbi:MAG: CDGSH iron-sulfur domain-containing protein [Bacteroidia bacterium]|jgi:CDGSH-type Zn-finger protein|nr:CDGSH iron-sulfur domain-containing protein [Bacteroidia bacterium]
MEGKENNKASALVEVIDGGPLKITGQILLNDQKKDISDNPVEVYLCRCGRSCNKPYCDESHKN